MWVLRLKRPKGVEGAKPSFFLGSGGSPAARGRDNVFAANPPPYYADLEGCAGLGGSLR